MPRYPPLIEGEKRDYRAWVAAVVDTIRLLTGYEPDDLVAFAITMEAVIAADVSDPKVRRGTRPASGTP
ncbi:hypothetical protein [Streptomyces scabiei]|uniref:hypothetical protein n=1 Tax=Streptomyces scabiei TaxID=1930 RepID=UPI00131B2CDD|nr:hypothetical protein [Streptomyces scabiei]